MIYGRWRRQPWRSLDCGETLDEDTCKDHESSAQRLLVSLIGGIFRRFVSFGNYRLVFKRHRLKKPPKEIRFSETRGLVMDRARCRLDMPMIEQWKNSHTLDERELDSPKTLQSNSSISQARLLSKNHDREEL